SPSVRKSGSLNSVLSRNVGATQQPRASLQATLSQSQVGSCRLLPGWLTSAAAEGTDVPNGEVRCPG
ncbi:hypothetical protein LEMLEM_LOCUS13474, partial [Lemmus lemmus]